MNTSVNPLVPITPAPVVPSEGKPGAPSVLLLGEMNAGKTTAIRSLVEQGLEVFLLSTEPGYQDILGDIPPEKLHWHYVPAFRTGPEKEGHSFDVLLSQAKLVNDNSYDTLQKMGGINKQNHQQFFDIISQCNNFTCQRTGVSYGDVAFWDTNRVFVLDSLSGVSQMAIRLCIGDKPFLEQRDYTAIQFQIRQLINGLCYRTKAWFVLTAHLERETDPITGAVKLMVSTVGKALAPELPRFFSDSIHCKMQVVGGVPKWTWNTLSGEVTVKSRNLPLREGLDPNFKLLIANWQKKQGSAA